MDFGNVKHAVKQTAVVLLSYFNSFHKAITVLYFFSGDPQTIFRASPKHIFLCRLYIPCLFKTEEKITVHIEKSNSI